jgi:Xaa-Pro aminopeptidase
MKTDFFGGLAPRTDYHSIFAARRKELVEAIKIAFPDRQGVVILFAAFEQGSQAFTQDKTFYYYTGINEPGAVIAVHLDGTSILYLPNYFEKRAQWMVLPQAIMTQDTKALGVDKVELLGNECVGYSLPPYFSQDEYVHMIDFLTTIVQQNDAIFTTHESSYYLSARIALDHLERYIPSLSRAVCDISTLIAAARRRKDMGEIEHIYRAVEITELAHESAVQTIKQGVSEAEVQASLEYMMIASHARTSFPSIVAAGKNSTILHYHQNDSVLKNGDVVVVDIGAEYNNYCADLTRTYPVSGMFSKRQKEIYNIVLQTQEYIASLAKPGMWLKNKEKPEQSLHHLAVKFLATYGYDRYFPHGIGHFLGLDVHDVGDYTIPLQEGDVITIEPGIYIPQENIGIRIEDNYWIAKDEAVCLSENLPKKVEEIEGFMQDLGKQESNSDEDDHWEDDEDGDDTYN